MTVLGEVLQEILRLRGKSQKELADCMGKTPSYVSHLVSGRPKKLDFETSKVIAGILGTPDVFWSDLFHDESLERAKPVSVYLDALKFGGEYELGPGLLVDFQIDAMVQAANDAGYETREKSSAAEHLRIEPFVKDQLRATTYDTLIGGVWCGGLGRDPEYLNQQSLTVKPGEFLLVFTKEAISVPSNMHIRLAPAASFVQTGLILQNGHVLDPGFEGPLTVAVHNVTKKEISVPTDKPFLSLAFEILAERPKRLEELRGAGYDLELTEEERLKRDNERLSRKIEKLENQLKEAQ